MPWIIVILALPVLGLSLYFLLGYPGLTRKMQRRYARAHREVAEKYRSPCSSFMSLGYCILRLFAPLM
ncbi:MAG: hypothetical protein LUF00_10000 [Lachnospiraceae bacterium]|nr:hypothetical protein [Lachnospiraceae bacterium]